MSVVHDYVEAIVRRGRQPMPPYGFEPDWGDQPYRHKVYLDAESFPLPDPPVPDPRSGSLADGLTSAPPPETVAELDLDTLAAMLRDSYGLGERRMGVNGNKDNLGRTWYGAATWSRGTASGGGLYPLEVYCVVGPGAPLAPGIYHYYTPHHSLRRLLAGDVTPHVRRALGDATGGNCFLAVSVKIWKNSFKYNSFSYHAVTMDVGTLLGTRQLWTTARGIRLEPRFWYDEAALDDLLGLDPAAESVMAVVPIAWGDTGTTAARPTAARVSKVEREKSRRLIRFEQVDEVHLAAAAPTAPPTADAVREVYTDISEDTADGTGAGRPVVPLPPADAGLLADPPTVALRRRRSSFGRFSSHPRLTAQTLSTVLRYATTGGRLALREVPQTPTLGLSRVGVFVNHVDGIRPGTYDYRPGDGALGLVSAERLSPFLQRQYFLDNYNLEQAAAIVTVLSRPTAAVASLGDRGYRVTNADVGSLAQAFYTCAAAAGIGCGAALGFDNESLRERFELTDGDQWPLLIIMLGHERADVAELDLRLS